jgi:hypothetical protein
MCYSPPPPLAVCVSVYVCRIFIFGVMPYIKVFSNFFGITKCPKPTLTVISLYNGHFVHSVIFFTTSFRG